MHTEVWGLFLAVVFALHNMEEYRSFEDFNAFYLRAVDPKFRHRAVFLYALITLTILVVGLCVLNYLLATLVFRFAVTIVAMSLLVNGIQRCISSLWARRVLPGTISAMALLIPCSVVYFVFLGKETEFGVFDILRWLSISMLVLFLSIRASLWGGYLVFHVIKKLFK